MSRHPSAPIVHITLALGLAAPALVSGPALAAAPEAALAAELVQVLSVEDAARTKRVKKSHRRWRWRKDPASGTVLAWTLALSSPDPAACEQVVEALPDPQDAVWLAWRGLVSTVAGPICGGDAWPDADTATSALDGGHADPPIAMAQALFDAEINGSETLLAAALEARAAIYFSVGRHADAVDDLDRAAAIHPSPDRLLRTGLSLMALGHDDEARAKLVTGLVVGDATPSLAQRARIAVDVLRPELQGDTEPGARFPDLEVWTPTGTRRLSSFEGPLVIDLWATWCGPCLATIPHLTARAPIWAEHGVTLIGVSVDLEVEDLTRFEQVHPSGYTVVWGGPMAMKAAGASALPTLYVLDADHRVLAEVSRWRGPADHRLDQAMGWAFDTPQPDQSALDPAGLDVTGPSQ